MLPLLLVTTCAVLAPATWAGSMTAINLCDTPKYLSQGAAVLLLFRHGESEHNSCEIFKHVYYEMLLNNQPIHDAIRMLWFDPSLTECGIQEAEALGDKLSQSGIDFHSLGAEFWTSTMARAIETALRAVPGVEFRMTDQLRGRYAGIISGLRRTAGSPSSKAFLDNEIDQTLSEFQMLGLQGVREALFPNGIEDQQLAVANDISSRVQERVSNILNELEHGKDDSDQTGQFVSLEDKHRSLAKSFGSTLVLDDANDEVDPHFSDCITEETNEQYRQRLENWLEANVKENKLYVISSHKHSVEKLLEAGGLPGYNVGNAEYVCVAYRPTPNVRDHFCQ